MVFAKENLREVLVMLVAVIAFAWNSLQLPIFFLFWLCQRYPEYRGYSEQKNYFADPPAANTIHGFGNSVLKIHGCC